LEKLALWVAVLLWRSQALGCGRGLAIVPCQGEIKAPVMPLEVPGADQGLKGFNGLITPSSNKSSLQD